jgi:flagellar biosynthesis protein
MFPTIGKLINQLSIFWLKIHMDKDKKKAVALEYGKNKTPKLIAKGDYEIAQLIIDEAKKHGIFITEDAELVALLSKLELDEDIPDNLFNAVAVILSWVYWLKGMVPGDEKK